MFILKEVRINAQYSSDPATTTQSCSTTSLSCPPDFSGNYLHLDAGAHTQRKRARLLSPEVGPEQGPLCLIFYYEIQGEAQGSLRVLLRDNEQEETLLWALKGDQGPHWREGRTILPQSPKEYQASVSRETPIYATTAPTVGLLHLS